MSNIVVKLNFIDLANFFSLFYLVHDKSDFSQVHEYLRSKLCSLYENDCIFDKFECCWSGNDTAIMTGSYNNFFRMFDRTNKRDVTLEAAREIAKPKTVLKPRKVSYENKFNCISLILLKSNRNHLNAINL